MKPYKCTTCKHETEEDTNHYGTIISFCKTCNTHTFLKYTGEIPKDAWVPEPFSQSHLETLNRLYPNGI